MINFIRSFGITLLMFCSLSNITSAQMTNEKEAEVKSISAESKYGGRCIRNCSLSGATSYIQRNFDGKERTVKIKVTFDGNGKVTNVQINPSTGNPDYDIAIMEDARRVRFSPTFDGKSKTVTFRINIVKYGSECIQNCALSRATSYIQRNFDGKERTVKIKVTFDGNGKVTNVQIIPSTGNSNYDSAIEREARRMRFSPTFDGKSKTVRFRITIVEVGSKKIAK